MNKNNKNEAFILASGSPRRRELLQQLGFSFRVIPSSLEETNQSGMEPRRHATYYALEKAKEVAQHHPRHWVLAADTIVVVDEAILGKPVNATEASVMLSRLSGRSHQVITGVSLVHADHGVEERQAVETEVFMRRLSAADIEGYIATGEPMDKAGAYGIQGIGGCLIQRIEGSYSNVVGLPLCETVELLRRHRVADPFK
ncbi:MAG: Maf family protein [Syntrophobacterales bacterium]|jgi:septum formation protein